MDQIGLQQKNINRKVKDCIVVDKKYVAPRRNSFHFPSRSSHVRQSILKDHFYKNKIIKIEQQK